MTAACDIYSFGRTFYVLHHHSFPDVKKMETSQNAIDRFLLRCCKENPKDRYQNVEEMKRAWDAITHRQILRINYLLFFLMVVCLMGAFLLNCFYEKEKEEAYQSLLDQCDYEQAILYQSEDIRAYQSYLSQAAHESGGKVSALKRIAKLYETYSLTMQSDIATYLIQECILTKDLSQYEYARQLIDKSKVDMEKYDAIITMILQKKDSTKLLDSLYQDLNGNESTKNLQIELLIALYEMQPESEITYQRLLSLYELLGDPNREKAIQYVYGLWLCEQKQAEIFAYIEKLEAIWKKEDAYDLANLYIEAFDACVEDEQKSERLDLLEYAQRHISAMTDNEEIKATTLQQIEYLRDKWKNS